MMVIFWLDSEKQAFRPWMNKLLPLGIRLLFIGKAPEGWDHVHCIHVDDILTLWKSTEKFCWLEWDLELRLRDTGRLLYLLSYRVHRNWRCGLSSAFEKVSIDHIVFAISQVARDIRGSSKRCWGSVRLAQIVGGCFGLVKNEPSPCRLLQWKNLG